MNTAKFRAAHSINAATPQIIAVMGSHGFTAARYFTGVGNPSSTTLPTGNGKYNAIKSGYVVSAAIVAGGSSYAAGDVLTCVGGTGTACQITVDAVSGGAIIDFHVSTVGAYSVYPTNAVSVTGGSGSGATFNLDFPAPDFYLDITTPTSPVLWICTTAGSKSTSVWNQMSGGGSSVQKMKVTAVNTDGSGNITGLTCDRYDAANAVVESSVAVALPYGLQSAPAAGLAIHPAYTVGTYLVCSKPIGGTGSTTLGSAEWMDLNVAARAWCIQVNFCVSGATVNYWVPATTL